MNKVSFKLIAALLIVAFLASGGYTSLVESLKQQLPPQEIQQTEAAPSPTPTATPTPSPSPEVKGTTKTEKSTKPSPKPNIPSGKPSTVRCQVSSDKWENLTQDECNRRQAQLEQSMVNCQTKTGWIVMKKEDCTALQKQERGEQQAQVDEEVRKALEARLKWFQESEKKCAAQTDPLVRTACYEILKQEAEKDLEVIESTTPTSTPCVCIESWGAGGFRGNCEGKSHCTIKYSCLLPDKKRLGVWNDDQTVCLEENVRYIQE